MPNDITIEDDEALRKKTEELKQIVLASIPDNVDSPGRLSQGLFISFINVTAPVAQFSTDTGIATTEYEGLRGGRTRKPGNIILSWDKLFALIPDMVLSFFGFTGPPWLLVFVALKVAATVWSSSAEKLSPEHAMTLYAMWNHGRQQGKRVGEDDAFACTNEHLARHNMAPLSRNRFAAIIDDLCALRCIKLKEGVIHLTEYVKNKY
ncbi:MAG: hypothetical protein HXY46_15430 [Syntrophaceae bacterium]|nr:hypothetical protein [Syntrophaceae bacterium]